MTSGRSLLAHAQRLPTLWRTVRPLRFAQAVAQLRHAIVGLPTPVALDDPALRLAVAHGGTAFLEPPAHVRALGARRIELLATPFDLGDPDAAIGGTDWASTAQGPLFAYHLHQHEYLRLPHFGPRERALHMLDWLDRHPRGIGWDPHPISLRLLCWGKLLVSPGALELAPAERERLLASMAAQAETLRRGLEIRLQANHLLSNLISLVWTGMLLEGRCSGGWLAHADRLQAEIDAQIHADGGHEERSPMYHSLLLESLLDLLNLCASAPERVPSGLETKLRSAVARMLGALEVWTHPDGRIALFADSGFDVAAEPARLADYAARLGVPSPRASHASRLLPETGYLRLRRGDVNLIASVAGPAPAHQPGHAHCDALAFELAFGRRRLVTDTGLYEYLPGVRRQRARATASHATLQIDDEEQAEIWSSHRVGGRPEVELIDWDGEATAEAGCRGWSRPATRHRRRFELDSKGLTLVDRIEGPCRGARLVLPLAPEWDVELAPDGRRALAGSAALRSELFLAPELAWRIERAPYYTSFGREVERAMLVGEGPGFAEARTRIAWLE